MGSSNSVLTEDILEEYTQLSYLSRAEILELFKKFSTLGKDQTEFNLHERYPVESIKELFPQLKYNPFRDRIYQVFSSWDDYCFSFEDMLDLCSVMSENCPDKIKAVWAFRIFDFDDDGQLGEHDLMMVIDRLTQGLERDRVIPVKEKKTIVSILMKDIDLESKGSIEQMEFEHALSKLPDFRHTFSFRI